MPISLTGATALGLCKPHSGTRYAHHHHAVFAAEGFIIHIHTDDGLGPKSAARRTISAMVRPSTVGVVVTIMSISLSEQLLAYAAY
ncbi:hypothetical protein [Corynebacterium diphtheriae]|uniref:hypothetical protein n=1 Tax=Corynebacterium diphtheriae TaxID=1717 RepID=UPI000B62F15B|nr:hypothetical protein AY510_10980 [Corynebacterium diphtheriae bv. gravis]OWO51755.1 hypothetical protein AY551_09370 [Corynebacterium diphtheriae bv. gravis]